MTSQLHLECAQVSFAVARKSLQSSLCQFKAYVSASPQVASSSAGDCAFEDDMCGWTNPNRNDGVDELNWERLEARAETRFPQVKSFATFSIQKFL